VLHEQLRSEARTDAKTGLLNAAAWNREAERQIAHAARTDESLAVLLLDIDHFKLVNDTYGHLVGDQMLKAIATAIQEEVRTYDVAGRFGGEEFVLFLTDADLVRAHRVAERVRDRIAALVVAPAGVDPVQVTVSIGVSMFDSDGTDLTELLASADVALYRAKAAGRDRTCFASDRV
jgi:diguanylate cyclase (GGDEF)-like protein